MQNINLIYNSAYSYKKIGDKKFMLTITDKEFRKLADFIKYNYGIYLKDEKRSLLTGRLNNLLIQKKFGSFSEYIDYIVYDSTGEATIELIDKITTNHTYFMREADHFYYFRDKVLPYLVNVVRDKDLRIWSAGCSTGEEPYTLAMIMNDFFGQKKMMWDTKLLATDISDKVLKTAKNGIYTKNAIESLPALWRLNHFKIIDKENYVLSDNIKNEVIFRKFNLIDDYFPFKRDFHVIFCRNVMIYFDEDTKYKLLDQFYNKMENGSFLFIGHSESINRDMSKFKYIMPAVYRKE